jgi:hypothetical protein
VGTVRNRRDQKGTVRNCATAEGAGKNADSGLTETSAKVTYSSEIRLILNFKDLREEKEICEARVGEAVWRTYGGQRNKKGLRKIS